MRSDDASDAALVAPAQPAIPGFANEGQPASGRYPPRVSEPEGAATRGAGCPQPAAASPSLDNLLAAFKKDSKPLAKAIEDLLKDLETADPAAARDRVNDFIANLNDLLPDDPATAAVIAEEMAKQFASGPRPLADEPLANEGHPYTKCPSCGKFMSPNGSCIHCGFVEDDDRLIARGKKALSLATTGNQKSVKDAMYKNGLGSIDFDLGWEGKGNGMDGGSGILKLQQKHSQDLPHLPETIAKGKIVRAELTRYDETSKKNIGTGNVDGNRMYVIDHPYFATLSKRPDGTGWTMTSHYRSATTCNKYESRASELTRPSK